MLELWGGHECSVVRIGDRWTDQTVLSGHDRRPEDLARFAGLGLTALRYPVLWERVSPQRPDERDWSFSDERLNELRRLGVRPIVGLIHHGSGPRYTGLLDDGFAAGLAAHARAVAERYPWVTDWTPVNEPLSTARFSALYGHWWPHLRDERASWTALLNQIDAVRLSMAAIREVVPSARLIQTEDLGFVHAPRELEPQARYENDRRWLTWDLLCGAVVEGHPLWRRLRDQGFEQRLAAIAAAPCPPDVIGVNHYLSSERWLDPRLERYPAHLHGGNGLQTYADVEAARVVGEGLYGLENLLLDAWRRYGRPLAVTECHNGCTREEQMRWFYDAWRGAERLCAEGVDVRAVTAWSLLGSYDWDSLLTREHGRYEVGVFDVRRGAAPTAMAEMLRALAAGEPPPDPLPLSSPGWWRRTDRFLFGGPTAVEGAARPRPSVARPAGAPVLITGATGTLGAAFARECERRGLPYVLTDRKALDLHDPDGPEAALERLRPSLVINAAGWVRVDEAETAQAACYAVNVEGTKRLAQACAARDLRFVTFSSDLVFDGAAGRAYVESDPPNPLNVYGRSKAEAERAVLAAGGRALVVRTAAFFGPHDPHNFAVKTLAALAAGLHVDAAADAFVSPTYVPDLVSVALCLALDGERGVRHLTNLGRLSWAEFATTLAKRGGYAADLVRPRPMETLGLAAPRPLDVALTSERGLVMPAFEDALDRFMANLRPPPSPSGRP